MRFVKFVFSRFFICITLIAALTAAIIFLCIYIHSLLPAAAAIALAYTLSLVAAACLLFGNSPSEFRSGWLTLIIIFPVGGAILYFLSCASRCRKCGCRRLLPQSTCTSFEYFDDGAKFLDRLITLVSTAKKYVYLEFYIISKGHIWGLLNKKLTEALARGVEVKIIYDGLGSALRAPKRDFKALKKAGAGIKAFNKLMPFPVSRLNFRDHRKIAVIDGESVFLGGVNIADEYANLSSPHGHWKDGGALFFGRIAAVYRDVFLSAFDDSPIPEEYGGKTENITLTPVIDEPEHAGGAYEDFLAQMLYGAKVRAYIFTPYLCMGEKLGDALSFAAGRGVDVKIIIPHVPDKKLTYAITRTYCERLAEKGVQIFTYTPGFMHFKGVVCDDRALLGSYNFDFRSMRLNYECAVFGGEELAYALVRDFTATLAVSAKLTVKKRCAAVRTLRSALYLLAPLV